MGNLYGKDQIISLIGQDNVLTHAVCVLPSLWQLSERVLLGHEGVVPSKCIWTTVCSWRMAG